MVKKNFREVVNLLESYKRGNRPSEEMLRNLLSALPEKQVVTNLDSLRYNYRMGWKIFLPIGVVSILLVVAFFYLSGQSMQLRPSTSTTPPSQQAQGSDVPTAAVNAVNADQTLSQTGQAVDDAMKKVDEDMRSLDQIDQAQDSTDSNSL